MNKHRKILILGMVLTMLITLIQPVFAEAQDHRLAVPDGNRYSTAGAVAQEIYPNAQTVIIVRGDSEEDIPQVVDALSASGLAGAIEAPILLTPKDRLHKDTITAIEALGAKKAIIVGGEQAIEQSVISTLEKMGLSTERIEVKDGNRYDTAAKVADRVIQARNPDTAIITGGHALVDALTAGPLAHEKGYPILLVNHRLQEATETTIKNSNISNIIIVGGESVVSLELEQQLKSLVSGKVARIAGENRYGTSLNFAKAFYPEHTSVALVNGYSFVDAVGASILEMPIVYVQQDQLSDSVEELLTLKQDFRAIGGPMVISDGVVERAYEILGTGIVKEEPIEPEDPGENFSVSIETTQYSLTLNEALDIQMRRTPQTNYGSGWETAKREDVQYYLDPGNFALETFKVPTAIIRVTTANVRNGPGLEYDAIDKVHLDQRYEILEISQKDKDGHRWLKLDLEKEAGWVREDLITVRNPRILIKHDNVRVRMGPGLEYAEITKVHQNQEYEMFEISSLDKDQYHWYRIQVSGQNGWVREDLGEIITENHDIPSYFYQFLVLSGRSGATTSDLNNILANRGILHNMGEYFMQSGKNHNINEIYLVSHALLESGNGTSTLSKGAIRVGQIEENKWVSVQPQSNGEDEIYIAELILHSDSGYWYWNTYLDNDFDTKDVDLKKTFNMFGIGAVDGDPYTRGSVEAFRQGWFTVEKAIVEGGEWISKRYVNHSTYQQDTLYKMRWNPQSPGNHQYATDIGWALKQTLRIKSLYEMSENYQLRFDVPEYKK